MLTTAFILSFFTGIHSFGAKIQFFRFSFPLSFGFQFQETIRFFIFLTVICTINFHSSTTKKWTE